VQLVGVVLLWVLRVCFWVLMARAVLSWVPMLAPGFRPHGAVLVAFEAVYTVTDPPLKALRKVVRPLNLGGVSLDLAFMVLLVIIMVMQRIVAIIFL
jgi:YggT family protein